MPLIECPQCHHRVSSVASACPECGSPVAERLWDEMRRGEYYGCGKCGEPVAVHASVCRNCGVPDPRRKRLRIPQRFALAVGLAVALLVAAVSSSERPTRPVPTLIPDSANQLAAAPLDSGETPASNEASDSAVSAARVPSDLADTSSPVISRSAEASAQRDTADARPVPRPLAVAPPIPDTMTDGQPRWTSTWVNVRSGPGRSYPVVLTLNPDSMVIVDSLRGGWWLLLDDGRQVGYVANSVLRRSETSPSSP